MGNNLDGHSNLNRGDKIERAIPFRVVGAKIQIGFLDDLLS